MFRNPARARALLGLLLVLTQFSTVASGSDYPHAREPIGTVREVCDGALFPDTQVNTIRNIDRLFPS